MTTLAYTAIPGAPHYIPPRMRLRNATQLTNLSFWKADEMHWRGNGEISTLHISKVLGKGLGKSGDWPEQDSSIVEGDWISMHDPVSGRDWFFGRAMNRQHLIQSDADEEALGWVIYGPEQEWESKAIDGQWGKAETTDDLELIGILAPAFTTRNHVFQTQVPCCFNYQGKPNATQWNFWKLDSVGNHYVSSMVNNGGRVFEGLGRRSRPSGQTNWEVLAVHWDVYNALRSLIEWYGRYDTIHYDASLWPFIYSVVGTAPLGEVNIQGDNLLQAVRKILSSAGFGFYLEPWPAVAGGSTFRLIVYSLADGRNTKRPHLADNYPTGVSVPVSGAEGGRSVVKRVHFAKDYHGSYSEVQIIGAAYKKQWDFRFGGGPKANWDLVPMWDPATHPISVWLSAAGAFQNAMATGFGSFHDRHDTDGKDHQQYQDVYRSFTLNEDGVADEFGWAAGTRRPFAAAAYLLETMAGQSMRRPRPAEPPLEEFSGRRVGSVIVEMGLVDPNDNIVADSWRIVHTKLWPDRCGFTLTQARLGWDAAGQASNAWRPWGKGGAMKLGVGGVLTKLKFRRDITYMRALNNALDNTSYTWRLMLRMWCTVPADTFQGVTMPGIFMIWPSGRKKVLDERTAYQNNQVVAHMAGATGGNRDDGLEVAARTTALSIMAARPMGHTSLTLRHLSREYELGDAIDQTEGRVDRFHLDTNITRPAAPLIVEISWIFGDSNKTELVMDSPVLSLASPPRYAPVQP